MGVAVEFEVRDVRGGPAVEDELVEDFEGGVGGEVGVCGIGGWGCGGGGGG